MSKLRADIQRLAEDFSARLLAAISHSPVGEIFGDVAHPRARKATKQRAAVTVQAKDTVAAVVSALRTAPGGMRSEQLRSALRVGKDDMARALREALKQKVVRKRGQRRGTTYSAT